MQATSKNARLSFYHFEINKNSLTAKFKLFADKRYSPQEIHSVLSFEGPLLNLRGPHERFCHLGDNLSQEASTQVVILKGLVVEHHKAVKTPYLCLLQIYCTHDHNMCQIIQPASGP